MTMSESTPNIEADTRTVSGGLLHVAVAAIVNGRREVLVSLRPDHVHQGGLWEFPGGKLEARETVQDALKREIHEELGITIRRQRPLIRISHQYPDRSVLLDVWRVDAFEGVPHGKEGQPVEWVPIDSLSGRNFPAANRPIVCALQLPSQYLITPEPRHGMPEFLERLEHCLDKGIRLVQLRAKSLQHADYLKLAVKAVKICHDRNARILLNADPELVSKAGADGVQLDSRRLSRVDQRPLPQDMLVGASCHNPDDLARSSDIGADFALLSPVQKTASHPEASALGWQTFAQWVELCSIPVYALGGVSRADTETAISHGAQGIAAIRGLWGDD